MSVADEDERPIPNEPTEPAPPHATNGAVVRQIRPTPASRVPPHDLNAEEGLLCTMLFSTSAIDDAVAIVQAEDFYKPAHGHIFEAAVTMYARGETPDPISVGSELGRTGLLEAVGGTEYLLNLRELFASPSIAGQYARTIAERARYRRAIGVAGELAEAAYSMSEEAIGKTIIEARSWLVSSVATTPWEDVAAVIRGEEPPLIPTILRRNDDKALIYPGLLHWLYGPPGTGKTMVALAACADVLSWGGTVLYLDWEGNRRIVGDRLRAFGISAEVASERFHYARPPALTQQWMTAVVSEAQSANLCIYDGAAKAMARQGFNEDKAPEVLAWLEMAVSPVCESGCAALVLDHVTKAYESREWARGSGAKLGEVSGAAWELQRVTAFNRQQEGEIRLVQRKDREGWVGADGDTVASIRFIPDRRNGTLRYEITAPQAGVNMAEARAMEKAWQAVSDWCDANPGQGAGVNAVERITGGHKKTIGDRLVKLTDLGHLRKDRGKWYPATPYRAPAEEPPPGLLPPEPEESPELF